MRAKEAVTITIYVRLNDGPPGSPSVVTVRDGDTVTIMQTVEVTFDPGRVSREISRPLTAELHSAADDEALA